MPMASLTSAKTLGGIGGILVFIPGVSLVGWILILVALNEISDVVRDRSIFDDALIAGITAIIGAVGFLVFLLSGIVFDADCIRQINIRNSGGSGCSGHAGFLLGILDRLSDLSQAGL